MRRLLQVLLVFSWLDEGQSSPGCSLQSWPMETFSQSGDILIGGIVEVHSGIVLQQPTFRERPKPRSCTGFHIRYYRDVLGLMFTVDEINNSPDLLPNITLGFSALDSCMSEPLAVEGVLSLLSGLGNPVPGYNCHPRSAMVGIVGDQYSFLSIPVAQITGVFHFPQVLRYLKKTSFHSKFGELMKFNAQGDLPAPFAVFNMQFPNDSFNLVKVGMIDPEAKLGEKISLNFSAILWNDHFLQVPISVCSNSCRPGYRKAPLQGRPICCYDCVPCSEGEMTNLTDADQCTRCPPDQWPNEERDRCVPKMIEFLSYNEPLGIMLVLTSLMLSTLTLFILIIFIQYQDTPIIKATNRELSYILLVSLILCFLCCLVFIGQPSPFSCLLRQTFFSVVFSISISSVLAKTIMVILAFKATSLNSPLRKWLGPTIPRNIVGICFIWQISICSFWLYRSPPFPVLNTKGPKIISECNEGQKVFFYMSLGFMGSLAMVSFLVAFLARNLPGSFNEAKLITFSMLVFCCVWISFIPAYLSTSGKYTAAVQIFTILASSAGLLSCIFLPKCYIILLRPERNNREFLSGSRKKRNLRK